jgi:hypothetical protein
MIVALIETNWRFDPRFCMRIAIRIQLTLEALNMAMPINRRSAEGGALALRLVASGFPVRKQAC